MRVATLFALIDESAIVKEKGASLKGDTPFSSVLHHLLHHDQIASDATDIPKSIASLLALLQRASDAADLDEETKKASTELLHTLQETLGSNSTTLKGIKLPKKEINQLTKLLEKPKDHLSKGVSPWSIDPNLHQSPTDQVLQKRIDRAVAKVTSALLKLYKAIDPKPSTKTLQMIEKLANKLHLGLKKMIYDQNSHHTTPQKPPTTKTPSLPIFEYKQTDSAKKKDQAPLSKLLNNPSNITSKQPKEDLSNKAPIHKKQIGKNEDSIDPSKKSTNKITQTNHVEKTTIQTSSATVKQIGKNEGSIDPSKKSKPIASKTIETTDHVAKSSTNKIAQANHVEKTTIQPTTMQQTIIKEMPLRTSLQNHPLPKKTAPKQHTQEQKSTLPIKHIGLASLLQPNKKSPTLDHSLDKEHLPQSYQTQTNKSTQEATSQHDPSRPSDHTASLFEGIETPKESQSDTLKQKIIDARESVRTFSQTLYERIKEYKPPFQRIQLSLDPKELGNIDLTLIHRGNQLHIQLNANPTAINLMATQGQELKNQLISMGFSDVQMQFNMQQQKQQQSHPNPFKQAKRYIDLEELPTPYESLEIIIPNYA